MRRQGASSRSACSWPAEGRRHSSVRRWPLSAAAKPTTSGNDRARAWSPRSNARGSWGATISSALVYGSAGPRQLRTPASCSRRRRPCLDAGRILSPGTAGIPVCAEHAAPAACEPPKLCSGFAYAAWGPRLGDPGARRRSRGRRPHSAALRRGIPTQYRCGAAPDSHRIPVSQPQGLATAMEGLVSRGEGWQGGDGRGANDRHDPETRARRFQILGNDT
jgi:hypothetical protein